MKRSSLQRVCSSVMKQVGAGGLRAVFVTVMVGQAACFSWAADGEWVGTTGGNWSVGANWKDNGIASGTGATAYFTNGVGVTVTQDIAGLTLGNLMVANANTVYTNSAITLTNAANAAATVTVEGANTAQFNMALHSAGELVKAGTGTLTLDANCQNIKGPLTLNGGTLLLNTGVGGDGLRVLNNAITVNGGATLKYGNYNQIWNDARIEVKAGGILDLNVKSDVIGCFFGEGIVTNCTEGNEILINNGAQGRVFSGRCFGSPTSVGSYLKLAGDLPLVLGAAESFKDMVVTLEWGANPLGFLPGVGSFSLGGLTSIVGRVFALQATDKTPVNLSVGSLNRSYSYLGRMTGPGSLTKVGKGTLTLGGANTYAGGTTVSNGVLALGLANAITNNGAISVAGGTYELGGFTVTNGAVTISAGEIANGTLFGASYASTDSGLVSATLAGSSGITKSGPGTLALRGMNTFTGLVTVSGGTLEIQAMPAPGSAVWLDAATLSTLTKNENGTGGTPVQGDGVGRWISRCGSNWVSSASKPTYQTNVLNGLPLLRFTGQSLAFRSNVVAQGSTVFIVYRQTGQLGNYLNPIDSKSQTPTSGWLHMMNNSNLRSLTRGGGAVNVASTFSSTNWAVQAMQMKATDYRLWVNESAYGPSTATNEFTAFTHVGNISADFAEILIYTNLLSVADRMTTISYLRKKWLGVSGTSGVTNSLSPVLTAEIKAGAVLDLCGGYQTLVGLAGSGRVTNGTVTVTGRLTPGDTDAAAGVLTVGGNLTLAAGATNAFDYVAGLADTVSVAGTLTLQGANTVEVSLNGQPPPTQMTLFTFNSLVGEGYLTTWTVQGAGLESYKTQVKRIGNSLILNAFRNGTLLRVQ